MSQISFADAEYAGKRKKTRREVFLEEMELVVPWKALLKVIEPFYPVAGRGRRPYPLEAMLRGAPDAELVCAERPGDGGSTV
jgi:transposase, IS5 family